MSAHEHEKGEPVACPELVEIIEAAAVVRGPDGHAEVVEVVLLEIQDLAEHARHNTRPGKAKRYRIVVDREPREVEAHGMTGEQILKLVGKSPDKFTLTQKLHGGHREKVAADEYVDFTARGVERFETAPRSATNGEAQARLPLSTDDIEFLDTLGGWELVRDAGAFAVVIRGYRLPDAFVPQVVDLMIRVPTLYPAAQLDMFNVSPSVRRADNRPIPALSEFIFLGRPWQQWSRHRASWSPALDSIATHMALVENALQHDAR